MRTRAEGGFDAADVGDDPVVDGPIHHSSVPLLPGRLSAWPVSITFNRFVFLDRRPLPPPAEVSQFEISLARFL